MGLLHIIGTSVCFWVSAIVREIVLGLTLYANKKYGNSGQNGKYHATKRIFVAKTYIRDGEPIKMNVPLL